MYFSRLALRSWRRSWEESCASTTRWEDASATKKVVVMHFGTTPQSLKNRPNCLILLKRNLWIIFCKLTNPKCVINPNKMWHVIDILTILHYFDIPLLIWHTLHILIYLFISWHTYDILTYPWYFDIPSISWHTLTDQSVWHTKSITIFARKYRYHLISKQVWLDKCTSLCLRFYFIF